MEASRGDLKKRAIFAEKKCEKTEAELQIANGTLEVLERRTKTMLSQIDLLESRALTAEKKSEASARHLSDLESRLADTELRVKEKSALVEQLQKQLAAATSKKVKGIRLAGPLVVELTLSGGKTIACVHVHVCCGCRHVSVVCRCIIWCSDRHLEVHL
uniref:Uncharacterized protein n=1 Tax=Lotharella globosa TaxID=91324 RepID=A0A7S4DUL1_9EUKA